MSNTARTLPLSGLRVLDFTHAAAGPFASMFLADMGAEVVKVEKVETGDGARWMGVPMEAASGRHSDYSVGLNRNKSSVGLDLSSARGQEIARVLALQSDIVVQNFRPGVMDRMGLGFDALAALRPGLVYCSISAFGKDGPWSKRPANDIIMQSVSGLMGITGEVGGGPVRIGAPISDYTTGLFALSGILAAVIARDAHPEGQHVEVSMLEASLNLMCNYIPSVATLGKRVPRVGRGHATIVPYQAFECSDGKYVMVGAFTRGFWQSLARTLGHEEWIEDPRFKTNGQRLENRDHLVGEMSAIIRQHPLDHWLEVLGAADIPVGPVLELHDAIETEQVQHYETIMDIGNGTHSYKVVRSPIRVDAWQEAPAAPPPVVGQDTAEVLHRLAGLDDTALEALRQDGVI